MAGAQVHRSTGAIDYRGRSKPGNDRWHKSDMGHRCNQRTATNRHAENVRLGVHMRIGFDSYIAAGLDVCTEANLCLDLRRDVDECKVHAACNGANTDTKSLTGGINRGVGVHIQPAHDTDALAYLRVISDVRPCLNRTRIFDRNLDER